MNSKTMLAVVAASLLGLAAATESPQTTVNHIDHDKVTATFAKGGPLLETGSFKIQAGHRDAPGIVEVHEHDTDIFYVLEGSGTLVTGGKTQESKTVSPGEIRGTEIVGGEVRHLVKGDVIVIPSGVPHWFTAASGPLQYFVVKVTK